MKAGTIVSIIVGLGAAGGLTAVFVNNASPYAGIADALKDSREMHVVGQIKPGTLKQETASTRLRFTLTDGTAEMPVYYTGPSKGNLQSANQVVVIGAQKDGTFEARDMLVKCPSKYESTEK